MPAANHDHLAAAARRRADQAREHARAALRQLDQQGTPITFTAIAKAANISRALLYRDPQLRAEVERLRTRTPTPLPAAQRATQESTRRRIETLLDDVRELRAQNQQLRDHVARLLGEQRAAATTRPITSTPDNTPVGDMPPK
jgi:hypothetical protein